MVIFPVANFHDTLIVKISVGRSRVLKNFHHFLAYFILSYSHFVEEKGEAG